MTTTFVSSSSAARFAALGLGPSGSGALRLSTLRFELLGRLAAALLVEALQVLGASASAAAPLPRLSAGVVRCSFELTLAGAGERAFAFAAAMQCKQ